MKFLIPVVVVVAVVVLFAVVAKQI